MKKILSALVIGSMVLLTGCSTGVAAQIGDTKISQAEVQAKVAEVLAERRKMDTSQMQLSVNEELNRSELRFLLISAIFEKIAKQAGITITQAMQDARAASIYSQVGGSGNLPQALVSAQIAPSDFAIYIKSVLISEDLVTKLKATGLDATQANQMVQKMVLKITQDEGIKINPQYGAWDPTNADLVTLDSAGSAVKQLNK